MMQRTIFEQNLEDYIPTGPAESGKLIRFAEDRLLEAKKISDKASFLKSMDLLTREVIGLPDRLSKKVSYPQVDHSHSNDYFLSPLSHDIDRMRDASNSSLDMLKTLRQDLLSMQKSSRYNSMPSSDSEFQFDYQKVQQNSSIVEGSTKSVTQQKLRTKQSHSNDEVARNSAAEIEVSISGGRGGDDDEEEGDISSNQLPNSMHVDHPIPPPHRRDAEEVSTMIQELRALVIQLKERSLSLAPVVSVPVSEAEVQVDAPDRVPDTSVTLTAAAATTTADKLGSDTTPAPESSEDLVRSPSLDIEDGIVISSESTSSEAPIHSEEPTTTTTTHPDPPLIPVAAEDNLTQTPASAPWGEDEYDLFTAIGVLDPPPSSVPSSPPITATPAPANVIAQVPLPLPLLPPQPSVPTDLAAEVDLSGTWMPSSSSSSTPRVNDTSPFTNTHIHIHNHLAPPTLPPLHPLPLPSSSFPTIISPPAATTSNWTVQRVDEYGRVRRQSQPPQSIVQRPDDPPGRHRRSPEDLNFDSTHTSVDLSGLSLQRMKELTGHY